MSIKRDRKGQMKEKVLGQNVRDTLLFSLVTKCTRQSSSDSSVSLRWAAVFISDAT